MPKLGQAFPMGRSLVQGQPYATAQSASTSHGSVTPHAIHDILQLLYATLAHVPRRIECLSRRLPFWHVPQLHSSATCRSLLLRYCLEGLQWMRFEWVIVIVELQAELLVRAWKAVASMP